MRQKILALDLGKVCVHFDTGNCLRALGLRSIEEVPRSFLAACAAFEMGRIDEKTWLSVFRYETAKAYSDDQLRHAYASIIEDDIPGMPELARFAVDAGCRIVAISDTSPLHLDEMRLRISFSHLITGGVYSFEVGEVKPHQKMFEAFESRYGAPILYADDLVQNIDGARARGWNAHHFDGTAGLRAALAKALSSR